MQIFGLDSSQATSRVFDQVDSWRVEAAKALTHAYKD